MMTAAVQREDAQQSQDLVEFTEETLGQICFQVVKESARTIPKYNTLDKGPSRRARLPWLRGIGPAGLSLAWPNALSRHLSLGQRPEARRARHTRQESAPVNA